MLQEEASLVHTHQVENKCRGLEHIICEQWPLPLVLRLAQQVDLDFSREDQEGSTPMFYLVGGSKAV